MSHDVIVGLQFGDEGKGKVIYSLLTDGNANDNVNDDGSNNDTNKKYTHCVRFNGGPNAGHTIYHNGNKLVTHQIPTGIFYGLTCIIGSGCVIDIDKLESEIKMVEEAGVSNVRKLLKVAYNCHVITKEFVEEDATTDKIGSTKSGIRPTYREKYNRAGTRAETLGTSICGCQIINPYNELSQDSVCVLFEGAQGFMLDIDYGYYPYVTSSHCHTAMISTTGVSFRNIDRVYGIAKLYNTYVGTRKFQPEDDEDLKKLAQMGEEFGSTTGRLRQCYWLNLDELTQAIEVNGVSDLIINKCDIMEQLGVFKLVHRDSLNDDNDIDNIKIGDMSEKSENNKSNCIKSFNTLQEMKDYITDYLNSVFKKNKLRITFSSNKYSINF